MTTLDDLLRAVLANPADDGARLAYADRLEEEGQTERAEFIRVQVELGPFVPGICPVCDGRNNCPWCPRCAIRRRERELLKARHSGQENEDRWSHGFNFVGWSHQFRRGFVESVTCSCADWLAHGPTIVAAQPVTAVRLADAVIHQSGGNSTYYVGGLGMFPREYWRELENLPSRQAAHAALSAVCLKFAREKAALPIASL